MKNKFKKLIAMLLVVCMMFSFSSVAFAKLDVDSIEDDIIYVSLGDSTTNGYGLNGYEFEKEYADDIHRRMDSDLGGCHHGETTIENMNGLLMETPKAYPALFRDYLARETGKNVNLIQLATSAMRADDVRALLTWGTDDFMLLDTYSGNKDNSKYYALNYAIADREITLPFEWEYKINEGDNEYGFNKAEFESMASLYQQSVEAADVISINLGSNNFSIYLWGCLGPMIMGMVGMGGGEADYVPAMEELLNTVDADLAEEAMIIYDKVFAMMREKLSAVLPSEELVASCENLAAYAVYTFVSYCVNYTVILERIDELNPDAEVYLMNMVNFMQDFSIQIQDDILDMSDVIGLMLDAANCYVAGMAAYKDIESENGDGDFTIDVYYADAGSEIGMLMNDMKELSENSFKGAEVLHDRMISSMADWMNTFSGGFINLEGVTAKGALELNEHIKNPENPLEDCSLSTAIYLGLEKAMINVSDEPALSEAFYMSLFNGEFMENMKKIFTGMGEYIEAYIGANFDTLLERYGSNLEYVGTVLAIEELLSTNETSVGMLYIMMYFMIADGVVCHPSESGYQTMYEALVNAYETEHTATDETVENLIVAAGILADLVAEYYDEAYAYAYDYAVENGYIEEANNAIDAAIAAFEAIDHEGIGMSEKLAEEIAADIAEIIATLEAAKALLNEADELDAASLDALLALLNEAAELGEELLGTLEQLGVDVNEYVIIPALNEAYRILVEEVIPQVKYQLQVAVQAGTDWLMEKAGEAYAAFLAALPEIDAALYNYFYNNPEEVIAFFAEYGDEIGVLFAEYGDELFAVLGYIAYTFGDEALDYVMTHPCETVKFFLDWYAKYGERTWAMIHVYADALGICQCENVDEIIADLIACGTEYVEAVLEALKAHIAEELADEIAYIEALIEQIKNAVEDKVEDVIDTVKEQIDAAVAELQAKLAELVENYEAALYGVTHVEYYSCPADHVYVSLGGAVASGDGLGRRDSTYTDLFAAYLDENVANVTVIDRTAADLDVNGLAAYIMANADAIASADLITYNLDAAGILDAVLAGDEFVNNWAAYASAEDVAKADEIIAEITALLAEEYDPMLVAYAEDLVETVAYAAVAFGVESYKALETISAINPEATVLAIGMYNPFAGMTVTVGEEVMPIGDYFDYAIEATNLYYELYAMATDNITFVEADEVEIADTIEIELADELDIRALLGQLFGVNDAMLATAKGHEYIADCIADAILFVEHDFVYIETVDPTYTAKGFDIYECTKCGAIEYRNFTDVLPLPINPSAPVIPVAPEKYECDGGENCPCRRFTDLDPTAWYHYGVDYMILKGIMIGVGDGQFAPHKAITRAEVAQMLWRLEGCPEATVELNFSDVAADAWYTEAVRWAVESETFLGYGDGTFGPNDIITREQLAAVMFRYAAECEIDVTAEKALADFTDADTVSAWAVDSLEWAYAVEMMIGTGDGKMNPLGDATRATIATVFHRYIENILKLVLEDVK